MSTDIVQANDPQLASFAPEVLCEIFLASIPSLGRIDGPRAQFPWEISHVCRHWRHSALALPKLWAFLDLEQTQENEEPDTPDLNLLKTYLERSGKHPLTFRLAYSQETIHGHPFLGCLFQHSMRWRDVCIESPALLAVESLSQGATSEFPLLRSLVCADCEFDSDAVSEGAILEPMPWAQLQRYHEYECSWYPDDGRQWAILAQLANVVDLRASFYGTGEDEYPDVIAMPHLRFAYFGVDRRADDLGIEEVLERFDLPRLEGLSVKMGEDHDPDVLCPVPGQFKTLKVLRLCGKVEISNEALTGILTEIPTLVDFAVELIGVDADHFFALLTPRPDGVLVPQLQALRITPFARNDGTVDALFAMLRARFGGVEGVEITRLRMFALYIRGVYKSKPSPMFTPSEMLNRLRSMKAHDKWDIRVDENSQEEFWKEDMDDEFI
ncbi:hypothetical protein DFH07DRAFT_148328 [Mycena maculata]|uniref:F-box domain-containing protein n=1 Tax=Mycena maculata TaxID=230809 RepID=A0AAD7NSL7_9AGAR|nr:hypothetical protein DFH07DRAFT_148328 [Mycena maculata]